MTEWTCMCTACKNGAHQGGGHCGASINGCVPDLPDKPEKKESST